MDRIDCSAIYIDPRVQSERWVYHSSYDGPLTSSSPADEPESLRSDVDVLLGILYLCQAGASLATKLAELSDSAANHCTPVFAFFDIDLHGEEGPSLSRRNTTRGSWPDSSSSASLRRGFTFSSQSEGSSDLKLLSGLSTDIQVQDALNLVIPVAILRPLPRESTSAVPEHKPDTGYMPEPQHISKCLDAGALTEQSRFMSRKKLRKHSWVGVHDEQPYSYLREAMVSKLMKGICNPEDAIEELQDEEFYVSHEREEHVRQRIGQWSFTAHEFSDDELVFAAYEIIQHAFKIPELEEWRLTPGELRTFLLACRASYNSFVLYHNFRHAIDVLQSVFCFLLHIGALPPYGSIGLQPGSQCPIASIVTPFDSLTLLIAAIGHDVGHPGVNNFFLVKLNAPLAQLYNDNSVLEAFHCAAFSQILRRYWPAAFKDRQLRKLLISSILATDMGVHQKFMERLGSLQEKYYENQKSVDGWKAQDIEMYKTLICGLLIKCADISNVARPWDVAEKWTQILQEEFANQGEMEKEVGMETALFGGPPEIGNVYKLATGQMGFMSIFALPLFEGISDVLPELRFTVEHIRSNHSRWHYLADMEKKKKKMQFLVVDPGPDGLISPRSHSPATSVRDIQPPLTTNGRESLSKPLFPGNEPTQWRKTSGGYFGSPRTSVASEYNENTISPVVSPDTPGPSMDITGGPFPVEAPSRKSSSAVPDMAMISIPGPPPPHRYGSVLAQQSSDHTTGDVNGSSRDPAVVAAVIFADTSSGNHEETLSHSSAYDSAGEGAGERANGMRNGGSSYRHQHANTGSSARTSAPSHSQRNSCTRTQSISTHSNAVTPISPSTNATSLLSADSDDMGYSRDNIPRSDYPEWDNNSTRAGSPRHGATVDVESEHTLHSVDSHTSHPLSDDSGKNHISFTTRNKTGGSSAHSGTTTSSLKHEGQPPHWDEPVGVEQRKLPKRRSRLRLAFWKRRTYHSNNHEVTGET
ncbi:hypothetical protein AOCH_006772 [Aspergillus ochraceoroseus]|uniref:Phosphodiesterase n=1 Tax=Aspergillus ochraceoroseus TaxID=138278 RepID=A0A0F8UAV8_9EURO|nr:hypothetical protein AOCH_006772 [Aspergillus ochraceoroseus]